MRIYTCVIKPGLDPKRSIRLGSDYLYNVGILPDGALYNPNGYPEDLVRTAIEAANAIGHEYRSRNAKKAAETRRRRQEKRVHEAAKRIVAGRGIPPQRHCSICGRGLDDPQSIARAIGSECWQDVLAVVERLSPGAPQRELSFSNEQEGAPAVVGSEQ
jgi:hypothetical protein